MDLHIVCPADALQTFVVEIKIFLCGENRSAIVSALDNMLRMSGQDVTRCKVVAAKKTKQSIRD